jgi:hypothetical protein
MNKICFLFTVWTKTNNKLLEFRRGKIIDFFQHFVPLWPDVAKRQHVGIRLNVSSLDSKMEFGNLHT